MTEAEMIALSDMTRDKVAAWLNLGTAKGQKSYVDTFDDLLPTLQRVFNEVAALRAEVAALKK